MKKNFSLNHLEIKHFFYLGPEAHWLISRHPPRLKVAWLKELLGVTLKEAKDE